MTARRSSKLGPADDAARRAVCGVGAGDLVLLEKTERGTYQLVPAALVPKDQLWFHHPEMKARVAEAEASFTTGRSDHRDQPSGIHGRR